MDFDWFTKNWFFAGDIGKSHAMLLAAIKEIDADEKKRKTMSFEERRAEAQSVLDKKLAGLDVS